VQAAVHTKLNLSFPTPGINRDKAPYENPLLLAVASSVTDLLFRWEAWWAHRKP
jgi:hypothetical protein